MAAYDMLSCLDLKLRTEFESLSLAAFALPSMEQLPPGFEKVWVANPGPGQWVRVPRGAASLAGSASPQLPPAILQLVVEKKLASLCELHLTWDSAWP